MKNSDIERDQKKSSKLFVESRDWKSVQLHEDKLLLETEQHANKNYKATNFNI